MDFSDEQLDFIRKNKDLPIQQISKKLGLTETQISNAIEGLTGSKPLSTSANMQTWGKLFFYPFIFLFFVYSVYFKQDFIDIRMAFIGPVFLFLFCFFFLNVFNRTSILINSSPFDIPQYSLGLLYFLFSLSIAPKEISLYNLNIGLFICLFYFLLVNTTKESFNIKVSKYITWLVVLFSLLDFENSKYFIPFTLPFLLCFALYDQKKLSVFLYSFVIPLLYLKCIYSNDLQFIIITFVISIIYLITLYVMKNITKESIIRSSRLKVATAAAISFAILISLFQNFIQPINEIQFSSLQFVEFFFTKTAIKETISPFLSFKSPIHLKVYFADGEAMKYISLFFSIFFLFFSIKSVKQADCFSEKIFAAINIPITIYLFTIIFFTAKMPVLEFFFLLNILGFNIGRQVFYTRLDEGKIIKVKKEVFLMKPPTIIFGAVLLLYSCWFIWDASNILTQF